LAIVCEAITEIIGASTLFEPLRSIVKKRRIPFFASLIECKYCLSMWVAALIVIPGYVIMVMPTPLSMLVMVLLVFLVCRLSNVFHILFDILYEYKQWRWVFNEKEKKE
jgi:hypothetical protein